MEVINELLTSKDHIANPIKVKRKVRQGFFADNSNTFFQPKLSIGPTDDIYEREADAVADQVMRMPEKKDQPFFSPKPLAIKPIIQPKCAACEEEEQLQRKEEESEEENVMLKSATTHISGADDDKVKTVQRQESPPESTTPDKKSEPASVPGINWFEMSRPFLTRGAGSLLFDPSAFGSISQQWNYNYNLFNFFGLGTGLSREASNFFTPFAIDSALKRDFPLPWEVMDRELNTSTIMISPTLFNFDIHNLRKSFTMPSPFRSVFGLPENPYHPVQRKCAKCEEEKNEKIQRKHSNRNSSQGLATVESVLKTSGQPLDNNTRSFMEDRMGYDFSTVRIHNDAQAHQSSKDINALAYTHGSHVVFGSNNFQPGTEPGKKLIAHELTHVVQQKRGSGNIYRAPEPEPSKTGQEFIPTATFKVTISGVVFTLPGEATFQPGKKPPQLIRIVLKALLRDQFEERLVVPITATVMSEGYTRSGHFRSTKDAYSGELIGPVFLDIISFNTIRRELEKRKLSVLLTADDEAKLEEAFFAVNLWNDFKRMAASEGFPLPAWYSKVFFDFQIQQDPFLLSNYAFFFKEYADNKDQLGYIKLKEAVSEVFNAVYNPIVILDAIRKDYALFINPETQLVYVSMWRMEKSNKPTVPSYIQSFPVVTEFLKFALKEKELFRDAETLPEVRAAMLIKFKTEGNFKPDVIKTLPPFPSLIVAPDLNENNTTITTAKNMFRMVVRFDSIHGTDIHGVTVAMAMKMFFSWKVFPLPASLKELKKSTEASPATLAEAANEFVKNSPDNLGTPVDTYSPDESRDQVIKMKTLGTGEYLLMGLASPTYREDLQWVQQPSSAGYPFFVFDADDLAKMSAYGDWDTLQSLKEKAKNTEDADEEKKLEEEIKRLETREKTDLLTITQLDLQDTLKLRDTAVRLKAFILEDKQKKLSVQGDEATNPFIIRLRLEDVDLYNLFIMAGQMFDFRVFGYVGVVEKFIGAINEQVKELGSLEKRTKSAYKSFKTVDNETPTYRVVAALVKEDDGNLVPLIMVAGYHPDADPKRGAHKIKLVDVTFQAPKVQEMIYVGETVLDWPTANKEFTQKEITKFAVNGAKVAGSEDEARKEAIHRAMIKFGHDNNYGEGRVLYRIPGTTYSGAVDSDTTVYEYLQMAIAALGLVVLILGVIASYGALTPVAAGIVTALGISVAVVGALMSAHNIGERKEKGTLEMDAEMALDIINIIGAVAIGVGQIARLTITASKLSQISKVMQLARLERVLLLYDAADFSANVFFVSVKVKNDIDAINALELPQYMKDNMIASVTFDAIQQGAIMAVGARGLGKQAIDAYRTKVEISAYKTMQERGWIEIDAQGKTKITEKAPPFLKQIDAAKPGTIRPADDQGQNARLQVEHEMLDSIKTHDGDHTLTLTERGRIIRCTDFCQDLRVKYEKELLDDPELHQRLVEIETNGAEAAKTKNEKAKEDAMAAAKELEADLASVVRREKVKSFSAVNAPAEWKDQPRYKGLLTKLQAQNISPGHLQDILDNAINNGEPSKFIATLYNAILEHEKSPMANFKKLIDGLANKNVEISNVARMLTGRIETVRTKQEGVRQVDRLLGRFTVNDLVVIRKNHPPGAEGDVEVINGLDSIIARTDAPAATIIEFINKSAWPSAPDKPDLLRFKNILESMPEGQKHSTDSIDAAIARSNEFARNVGAAMTDPVHGFERTAKMIFGDDVNIDVKKGKIEVEEHLREGTEGAGGSAYSEIINQGNRGDVLASQVFEGNTINFAKWEVIKKVINGSNIPLGIKNSTIGEIWSRINILKLKAEGYQILREVEITDGKFTAKADIVAFKPGEIRIIECKAMQGGLSPAQKNIYPHLEGNNFEKVRMLGKLEAEYNKPETVKSYKLERDKPE